MESCERDVVPAFKVTASGFKLERIRLTQGKQAGCEMLLVQTPEVCAAICPTRGMSLWRARLAQIDCQWQSPVQGPVHPAFVPLSEVSGLGWLDGFDELLVRCGLRSFGAPDFDPQGRLLHPLHGSIGNLPASDLRIQLSEDQQRLIVSGEIQETRFLVYDLRLKVQYHFQLGQTAIAVVDEVTNRGDSPTNIQLLYHINFGSPLLAEGARLHLPARQIVARDGRAVEGLQSWDRYLGPTRGYAEQVYFSQPVADRDGWVTGLLQNPTNEQAVVVSYQSSTLPYFTQWKNTASHSAGYVTGLEPATGFPNPRSFEEQQGRLMQLQPGQSKEFQLRLEGCRGPDAINAKRQLIEQLLGQAGPELSDFRSDWCLPR
jgi:galactose mutarotase-like enzyme